MDIRAHIANRIRSRLNALGIKYKIFADMCGAQPSVISRWLSGEHNFTIDTLHQIEVALRFKIFVTADEELGNACFPCVVDEELLLNKKLL